MNTTYTLNNVAGFNSLAQPPYSEKITAHLTFSNYVYPVNDGDYRIWNHKMTQVVTIKSGKKNGPGIVKIQNKEYFLTFVDNIPQGDVLRKDLQGNVLKFTVVNGSPEGEACETSSRGHEIRFFFKDGVKHGDVKEINSYGRIEYQYIQGIRQIPATIFGNDGKIYYLHFYKNKPNGGAKVIFPNGTKIYCTYNDGYPEGNATMVLPNRHEIYYSYSKGKPQGNVRYNFIKGDADYTLEDGKRTSPVKFTNNALEDLGQADSLEELTSFASRFNFTISDIDNFDMLYVDFESNAITTIELPDSDFSDINDSAFEINGDWINKL